MEIPKILEKKVLRCFGLEGRVWLDKLPSLVEACINKWNLTDCELSPVISFNYICFANSPQYGEVALKVGIPHFDLNTEMTAIRLYNGRNICRCYDFDADWGAMLLERFRPGFDLTSVAGSPERIGIAAKLVSALPIVLEHSHGLPKWSDLALRTFSKLRCNNRVEERMLNLVDIAEEKIYALENSGRKLVLLHGDLNHWNILMANAGWQAIDPKGQIGVAGMEAGRFILNELEIAAPDDPVKLMDEITSVFSKEMGEPRHIIALCAFLDKALSTSWKFEEHEQRDLTADVAECQFLLDYYLSLL